MDPLVQHELVIQALRSRLSTSIVWKSANLVRRILDDPELGGMVTPAGICNALREFVEDGGEPEQRVEKRAEYRDRFPFWYRVLLDIEGLPRPLFVELVLLEDDPEFPVVSIVNAHL